MTIKVPPRNAAQQGQTIIIKEKRTGCGCVGGALAVLATIAAVVLLILYGVGKSALDDLDKEIAFDRSQRGETSNGVALHAAAAQSTPSSAWKVGRSRDDMTDVVTYILSLEGLRIEEGIFDYTPRLVFQLPQSARLSGDFSGAECCVWIEPEAIKRTGVVAEIRIDQKPVEKILLMPGQNRSAVFLPSGFVKRLDGARTLIVRLETSLGKVRTLRFNLGGVTLDALAKKLKRETPSE